MILYLGYSTVLISDGLFEVDYYFGLEPYEKEPKENRPQVFGLKKFNHCISWDSICIQIM